MIFTTPRLLIRKAFPTEQDIELYYQIWSDARVMTNVGFPQGLRITRHEIRQTLEAQGESEFDSLLIIERRSDGQCLGECKLGKPDEQGIAETDVKLLPDHWRHRYGLEVKRGLLDYLFTHTDCRAVQATPNVGNLASIRMQETVGGQRVGEKTYEFPENMRTFTQPVHHFIYQVTRQAWESLPNVSLSPTQAIHLHPHGNIPTEDKTALDELLTRAFGDDPLGKSMIWSEMDWNVLVYEGDVLTSNVEILTRTISVDGNPVRVGGIGGVATLPERRGRGLASQAMQAAVQFIHDELKLAYGLLITGPHRKSFYQRLGWQEIIETVYFDQPSGRIKNDGVTMSIALTDKPWPPGVIDFCGLPW